ncbi:MAG TPA: hypothetical protein VMY37_36005 [Thermoguttaceae bacterium]|nr:hypothetical protein [Thermoguttaceae bacterium]
MVRSRWRLPLTIGALIVAATLPWQIRVSHAAERPARAAVIVCDAEIAPLGFAADEIRVALGEKGFSAVEKSPGDSSTARAPVRIVLTVADTDPLRREMRQERIAPVGTIEPQGYAIRKSQVPGRLTLWAVGADASGGMYAGLDLAEQIRLGQRLDEIGETTRGPHIGRRGIKFNVPLDARTPSYDDSGDAAQSNYVHMWDFSFWQKFLDHMARHRYNTLTLWNPHPFPSLVKLPDYPDVALDDVCVSELAPTHDGIWARPMFARREVTEKLRVVRKMPIDEKIAFWRRVMQHAADRGIDVYLITWNVIVNGAEGKYGITAEQDNPKTIAYLRQCVRECILTYPLLDGIGVTAGENMKPRTDEFSKEKWLWSTYGQGVLDAKREQPDRHVRFLHRVWQTGVGEVWDEFGSKYPGTFELGFKYARAHMYSATDPPFCDELCREMEPFGLKCWWNLRNDDVFNFRWGDPDYVREFLGNLPPDHLTAGYHMGSDGYVWGVEFTSLEPESPRALEIEKHWYNFMLWGRLGYDPTLDRPFFERVLAARFPEVPSDKLYDAWQAASKIVPLVNRFHWRNWDFMWAVEGCVDQRQGFHTVDDFINTPPMEQSGIVAVPDYVEAQLTGNRPQGTTPMEVAERLHGYAAEALAGVAALRRDAPTMSKQLGFTLGDVEAMAHLGNYYGAKILGAVELQTFRRSKEARHKQAAIRHLQQALEHWRNYAEVAGGMYRPQLLARTRLLDWRRALDDVKRDVEIARAAGVE